MRVWPNICGILALCGLAQTSWAGAWTLPQGEGLIISGTSFNQADLAFDSEGKLSTPVDFDKIDSTFYLEYGVINRLTLVGSTALQDVSYTSSEGPQQFSGFSTSKIGLRYGLQPRSSWVLAVQPSLVIPGGGEAVPDGDLGFGGFGAELRLLAGRSLKFGTRHGFFNAEAGYDMRSGGAPRQISADATLGMDVTEHIQIIGQGFYRHTGDSLFEGDTVLANESLKLQASLVIDLPKLRLLAKKQDDESSETPYAKPTDKRRRASLQIGVFQGVAGKNIVRESGVLITLWNTF